MSMNLPCKHCGKKFDTWEDLNSHVFGAHPDEWDAMKDYVEETSVEEIPPPPDYWETETAWNRLEKEFL